MGDVICISRTTQHVVVPYFVTKAAALFRGQDQSLSTYSVRSTASIGLDLHWNLWHNNDKNVFLVDNAHTKSEYFNRSTTWYYNQSTPARYANQSTQWYFNGRTTHVAENCRGGVLKFILFLLFMP